MSTIPNNAASIKLLLPDLTPVGLLDPLPALAAGNACIFRTEYPKLRLVGWCFDYPACHLSVISAAQTVHRFKIYAPD